MNFFYRSKKLNNKNREIKKERQLTLKKIRKRELEEKERIISKYRLPLTRIRSVETTQF